MPEEFLTRLINTEDDFEEDNWDDHMESEDKDDTKEEEENNTTEDDFDLPEDE